MNTRKASRSRLADVLADIKKQEDDNDITPPPPKRRSTAVHHNESKNNSATAASSKATPSYILKLYDRSIHFSGDDSQENIPLYALIRSWVHGESPLKKDPRPKQEGESEPTPQPESVYTLPPPKSNAEINKKFNINPTEEESDLRIPPWVKSFKRPDEVEKIFDSVINTMSQAECMDLNRRRWRKVKDDWKSARSYHEARYEESFKTLHDMYSTTCEK